MTERTITALDALAEAVQLSRQLRDGYSHRNVESDNDAIRTADAIERLAAVQRMVLDCLSKQGLDPLDVLNGMCRSLPNVSVPPSRWLDDDSQAPSPKSREA